MVLNSGSTQGQILLAEYWRIVITQETLFFFYKYDKNKLHAIKLRKMEKKILKTYKLQLILKKKLHTNLN